MSIWGDIKGFLRAFRSGKDANSGLQPPDSLAETLEDSTHVRGDMGGGLARASTEEQHEIVSQGHKNYSKSFEEND